MTDKNKKVKSNLMTDPKDFLKVLKDFALTVNEECPEGHRRDPGSGACLPIGPTDYTAFTRSLNDDQGDLWRGIKDKTNETFDDQDNLSDRGTEKALLNAFDMDAPSSCGDGTTFSFVQRKCISMEEAERENDGDFAFDDADPKEGAAELDTEQRKALPDSNFGVPEKRKFPLNDCSHVRNAMARFNQAKGLTAGEKAVLKRKILSKARECGIKVESFTKASTTEDFIALEQEMLQVEQRVMKSYSADFVPFKKSPCPPGMEWDPKAKKCSKMKGFVATILNQANHGDIVSKQPEGRRDPVGFKCPSGQIYDFARRECIPLDPSSKTKSSEDLAAQKDLVPNPKGKPAKLPQDCPSGTIWDKKLERCLPLDSRKKTKSEEEAQTTPNGPGNKGCAPGEFLNPFTKKCMPKKKGSSEKGGDEGLTSDPAGKVKLPYDCPPNTIWDGTRRTCTPLDPSKKTRQGDPGPYNPKDLAEYVENISVAQIIKHLDEIIKDNFSKDKTSHVVAKDIPNEAFPPSLVGNVRRSLLHHSPSVTDPYDNNTLDIPRLRNSLARVSALEGYSAKAVEDAAEHLLYHAREVVKSYLGKS